MADGFAIPRPRPWRDVDRVVVAPHDGLRVVADVDGIVIGVRWSVPVPGRRVLGVDVGVGRDVVLSLLGVPHEQTEERLIPPLDPVRPQPARDRWVRYFRHLDVEYHEGVVQTLTVKLLTTHDNDLRPLPPDAFV